MLRRLSTFVCAPALEQGNRGFEACIAYFAECTRYNCGDRRRTRIFGASERIHGMPSLRLSSWCSLLRRLHRTGFEVDSAVLGDSLVGAGPCRLQLLKQVEEFMEFLVCCSPVCLHLFLKIVHLLLDEAVFVTWHLAT